MRFPSIPALTLALGVVGVACGNEEGPTSIEIDIEHLRILNGCAIAEGDSCQLTAVAMTADSVPIPNPILRWSSSSSTVATVTGESSNATVRGNAIGSATITVSNSTFTVSDDVRVTVLPCSKC